MLLRLLTAIPDPSTRALLRTILDSALYLTPLNVSLAEVADHSQLMARLAANWDDIVLLDWQIAESGTPDLVAEILRRYPRLRLVALLPEQQRQYRQMVWEAGACNGIPKEYMDQEWLSTVLCIMHRAIEREAKLTQAPA